MKASFIDAEFGEGLQLWTINTSLLRTLSCTSTLVSPLLNFERVTGERLIPSRLLIASAKEGWQLPLNKTNRFDIPGFVC